MAFIDFIPKIINYFSKEFFIVISMSKKKKVNKNKKKKPPVKQTKSCKKKCDRVCEREKVYGEPMPVKSLTYVNGEVYPRLVFKESLWTKFLRFLGLAS